jgi:polyisoprenoid-binding protein YceI
VRLIPRTTRGRVIGALAALAVLVVAVPSAAIWVYINVIKEDAPPPLSFEERDRALAAEAAEPTGPVGDTTAAPVTAADTTLTGTWKVVQPSQAGYRVKEILLGQDTEGVGRTDAVDGTVTIEGTTEGTTVTAAELGVDLTSVTSDESRRDGQFRGRLMDTETFPVALFVLARPIELGTLPPPGTSVDAKAEGTLTLRGVDKPVVIDLAARLTDAGTIEVQGSYDVVFADFGIPDPSNFTASTEDHGLLEFLVTLQREG